MGDANTFKPSPEQARALEVWQKGQYLDTIESCAEKTGIAWSTWYRWFDNCLGFDRWWASEAEKWFARQLPSIQAAVTRAAMHKGKSAIGSTADRKLFLERFDPRYIPTSRKEIDVSIDLDERAAGEARALADSFDVGDGGEKAP